MSDHLIPRGVRGHNPGNIDYDGTPWTGLSHPPDDGRFCIFTSPEYGIRAMVKILVSYYVHDNCRSVNSIINRWAPVIENNTRAYISAVCKALGVNGDQQIDPRNRAIAIGLSKAIIFHENGECPYSDEEIGEGVDLALEPLKAS